MALDSFSLQIVSDTLHLLMNTVEEGFYNYACIFRAFWGILIQNKSLVST